MKIDQDWPLVLLAATVGHFEITRELILKGADVNDSRGICLKSECQSLLQYYNCRESYPIDGSLFLSRTYIV